jgi:hypothetical protein
MANAEEPQEQNELTPDELRKQQAEELPNREVMSTITPPADDGLDELFPIDPIVKP